MSYLPLNTPSTQCAGAPGTIVVPAGHMILDIVIENTSALPVLGGIKIGTVSGGADVVTALVTGATTIQSIPDASVLKKVFSSTVNTTLFIDAVTSFNTATVNVYLALRKFKP